MFSGCENLTKVNISNNVVSIGATVFEDCISLEEIVLPESLSHIGEEAFLNCSSLKTIVIPENVLTIEASAFKGCAALKDVTMMPIEPPILGSRILGYDNTTTVIKVPVGTIDAYNAAFAEDGYLVIEQEY